MGANAPAFLLFMFIPGFTAEPLTITDAEIKQVLQEREKRDTQERQMRKVKIDKLFPNRYGADLEAEDMLPDGFN